MTLKEGISRCRKHLEKNQRILWISFQSNLLTDTADVSEGFKNEFKQVKKSLASHGWLLPTLNVNMRNQRNIARVKVESDKANFYQMQYLLPLLNDNTLLVGEVPVEVKLEKRFWENQKHRVFKYVIDQMNEKNDKNILFLLSQDAKIEDVAGILKTISNSTVLMYPIVKDKKLGEANVKAFIEDSNIILVTHDELFNGCETSKVVYIKMGDLNILRDIKSSIRRAIEHLIIVNVTDNSPYGYYFERVKQNTDYDIFFNPLQRGKCTFL